ncbi:MAG: extracellular solute-binding protein [Chloroflexi bacterium]|nr:extracellular solute-binding protein [Chloroflexota bacterium]
MTIPVQSQVSRRRVVQVGSAVMAGAVGAACGPAGFGGGDRGAGEALKAKAPTTLTWWAGNGQDPGFIAIKDAFTARFPNVTIEYEKEASHLKPENLVAGVLAGTAPDATRFADAGLGDWASKGALLALDDRLKSSQFFKKDDFAPRLLDSGKWAGKFYAIPFLTDTRPLFWNAEVFKAEGLNPEKGPANWDELKEYTMRMTRRQGSGYERVGFIPLFGNSWLYLFGWLNGAEPVKFSADGKKVRCIMDDAKWVQALEYLTGLYTAIGGKPAMDGWLKEASGSGAQHALLTGRLGMMISTDTFGGTFGRYAPDLEYGFTLPPAPRGKQPLTWSGIWNMVVMKDSKQPDVATEFISFTTSVDGLRAWAEGALNNFRSASAGAGYWYPNVATNRRGGDAIFEVAKGQMPERGQRLRRFSQQALESSRHRPVMPAGLDVWDVQRLAQEDALSGKMTPKSALEEQTRIANAKLQELGILL